VCVTIPYLLYSLEKSLRGFQNELQYRILPPKEAAIFFRQIVHAVAYCHSKGVSHNDIKPGNVLLFSNDNNQKSANLCDFEFAARKGCQRGRVGGTKFFRPTKVLF
jgi:serine/threonine protein kinase